MTDKPTGVTVADGECPMCGHAVLVKATKKSFLCFTCPAPADGGCGHQTFSRSTKADGLIAKNVAKKWRKAQFRAVYLVADDDRPPAGPSPTPPAADPTSETREERDARIRKELFGE